MATTAALGARVMGKIAGLVGEVRGASVLLLQESLRDKVEGGGGPGVNIEETPYVWVSSLHSPVSLSTQVLGT